MDNSFFAMKNLTFLAWNIMRKNVGKRASFHNPKNQFVLMTRMRSFTERWKSVSFAMASSIARHA